MLFTGDSGRSWAGGSAGSGLRRASAKGLLGWCIFTPWDSRLRVSSRGYMLGYNDLKDPSVSGFFRFLAKVGDNGMKMQIVKIGFGGKL